MFKFLLGVLVTLAFIYPTETKFYLGIAKDNADVAIDKVHNFGKEVNERMEQDQYKGRSN